MDEPIKEPRKKNSVATLLAAVVVLAALVLGISLWARQGLSRHNDEETFPEPRANPFTEDQFYYAGEFIRCQGQYTTTGVDVSEHQGEIDWAAVKAAGVDFAIIRVGYRGYDQGGVYEDSMAQANLAGAAEAGLDLGVYFYSTAVTPKEAREEAKLVCEAIEGIKLKYPVVFDWEIVPGGRNEELSSREATDVALAFCEYIEDEHLRPAVYFNQSIAKYQFRLPELQQYDFWLAQYNDAMTFYYNVEMWQYTCTGDVPGIGTTVDLNLCFKDYR